MVEILDGPIVGAGARPDSSRWRVIVGTDVESGKPVSLPAAGINLLVSGPSGSGKSYVAGLLIEQLAGLGYSVLVIDPEGDHELLGRLAGVAAIGGRGTFPTTSQAVELMLSGPNALVLDLSQRSASDRAYALHHLPDLAEACRAAAGRPHWIVIDEAHGARRGQHHGEPPQQPAIRTPARHLPPRAPPAGHLLPDRWRDPQPRRPRRRRRRVALSGERATATASARPTIDRARTPLAQVLDGHPPIGPGLLLSQRRKPADRCRCSQPRRVHRRACSLRARRGPPPRDRGRVLSLGPGCVPQRRARLRGRSHRRTVPTVRSAWRGGRSRRLGQGAHRIRSRRRHWSDR